MKKRIIFREEKEKERKRYKREVISEKEWKEKERLVERRQREIADLIFREKFPFISIYIHVTTFLFPSNMLELCNE